MSKFFYQETKALKGRYCIRVCVSTINSLFSVQYPEPHFHLHLIWTQLASYMVHICHFYQTMWSDSHALHTKIFKQTTFVPTKVVQEMLGVINAFCEWSKK